MCCVGTNSAQYSPVASSQFTVTNSKFATATKRASASSNCASKCSSECECNFRQKKNALQELIYNFLLGVAKFGSKRAKPRSEFRSKCSGAKRGAKFSSKYGLAEFSSATKYESERVIAKCRFSKYDPGN